MTIDNFKNGNQQINQYFCNNNELIYLLNVTFLDERLSFIGGDFGRNSRGSSDGI